MSEEKSKFESQHSKEGSGHFPEDPGYKPGATGGQEAGAGNKQAIDNGQSTAATQPPGLSEAHEAAKDKPGTGNQQPVTENMEVHHHSHAHGNKNWKAYLWEFLMLFLAVFCGFLAEYALEHMIEQQRGRQYIASLYEDLKIDNVQLEAIIPEFKEQDKRLDTMLRLIKGVSPKTGANGLYKYYFEPAGYPDFIYTDRTMQQLKNAGGMRLITNKEVSDSIISYDASVKLLEIQINEAVFTPLQRIRQMNFELYDFRCCPELGQFVDRKNLQYPLPGNLLTYDENKLITYYNSVQNMRALFSRVRAKLEQLNVQNRNLRELLKKEYDLE